MAGIMQALGLHRHVPASASAIGYLAPKLARSVSQWATVRPDEISGSNPAHLQNCVGGQWVSGKEEASIPDPLNGEQFIYFPNTGKDETRPFIDSLTACPKHGLHNPLKNPERYNMYGDVSALAAEQLRKPEVAGFFAHLIQRVSPKSHAQAMGEVTITCRFLENFSGDQVRFLAQGFHVSGDHFGQQSQGYRWPYGPTALITPFNFPLEIPALQCMGALYMGNKVLLHVDHRVSVVAEQFLRLLQSCGMPAADMDLIHGFGPVVGHIIQAAQPRNVLFTGSSRVAEQLAAETRGRLKLEDAGFDWKILGPDVQDVDFVAWQSDQDAYACSGQKCSAQSILFMHENWRRAGVLDRMRHRAGMRSLHDLTIGPVLTWTTARILDHVQALMRVPGAEVLFGGKELEDHSIPEVYGAVQPTAVFVPLEEMLKPQHFEAATTEVFGPLQVRSLPHTPGHKVVTEWSDEQEPLVLQALERMHHHLTAAVVSNDPIFCNRILAHSVNGTTYAGIRARTTGAPQNHWFGPAGDPRGAGIGTPEAIRLVWSCHREIIRDVGPVPQGDQDFSHRRPT